MDLLAVQPVAITRLAHDAFEARHEMLPLAIVAALIETLRIIRVQPRIARNRLAAASSGGLSPTEQQLVSCDNFS